MSGKTSKLEDIKLEDLQIDLDALGPLEAVESSAAPAAKQVSSDFEALQEALSRTMRSEQIKKILDEPAPSAFHFEWHPVIGCALSLSEVCKTCIARGQGWDEFQRSTLGYWEAKPNRPQLHPTQLMEPIVRRKPQDILVAPLSDLFQPDIDDSVRMRVLTIMKNAPQHRFFVLTKNPAYMRRFFRTRLDVPWPLPNVWLGISAEDQDSYEKRVYELLQTPAAHYWVAFEPLLKPFDPTTVMLETFDRLHPFEGFVQAYEYMDDKGERHWAPANGEPLMRTGRIEWVYVAGQRGPNARPPHPEWVNSVVMPTHERGCNVWFGGYGDYGEVLNPDLTALASDESLLLVNRNGEYRGRGAGSKTNMLSLTFEGEKSAVLSRKLPAKQKLLLEGRSYLQRAPVPVKLDSGIRKSPFLLTGAGMSGVHKATTSGIKKP